MKIFKTLLTVPLACLLVLPAYAHQNDDGYGRFDKRVERQQSRIRQGVKTGDLTRNEALRLRKQQKQIAALANKFNRDGFLSRHEKNQLEKKQNNASNLIYKLKHNNKYRHHHGKHQHENHRGHYKKHGYDHRVLGSRYFNDDNWSLLLRLSDSF